MKNIKKIMLFFILFFLFFTSSYLQAFYYYPPDMEFFYYSHDECGNLKKNNMNLFLDAVSIRFEDETSADEIKEIVETIPGLAPFDEQDGIDCYIDLPTGFKPCRGLKEYIDNYISKGILPESEVSKVIYLNVDAGLDKEKVIEIINNLNKEPAIRLSSGVFSFGYYGPKPTVTDEFIVRFNDGVTEEEIKSLNAQHGVEIVKAPGDPDWLLPSYLLRLLPESNSNVISIANIYAENPKVKYAEPDFINNAMLMAQQGSDTSIYPNSMRHDIKIRYAKFKKRAFPGSKLPITVWINNKGDFDEKGVKVSLFVNNKNTPYKTEKINILKKTQKRLLFYYTIPRVSEIKFRVTVKLSDCSDEDDEDEDGDFYDNEAQIIIKPIKK